ncbi:low molecular weight phosphotyrosine protein phosphatase [Ancylostoma duodenale]|uniref:Low molecular weight phosphotyrosine protein phosphatase n=1 Tax=Ancylostoma duodenale TaxID=51022 RepID=A0A0C2CDN1_9BILA|nr:low molecular weight phosphotyrosine protein phosphatase [Ancylostoma duodenale]
MEFPADLGRIDISKYNFPRLHHGPGIVPYNALWIRDGLWESSYLQGFARIQLPITFPSNKLSRLGNICRSPIAEAVFLDIIKKRGISDQWKVESSAVIDFHTGKSPDRRAMDTLKKFGITDYSHRARVTTTADFREFDYIFGMDNSNISDLESLAKETKGIAKIGLLGEYDPEGHKIVPDPYYESGTAMFEQKYSLT